VLLLASETLGGPVSLRSLLESRAPETHTPWKLLNIYVTFTLDDVPRAITSGIARMLAVVGMLWLAPALARDRPDRRKVAIGLGAICAAFLAYEFVDLLRRGEGGYAFGKGYFGFLHHADLIVTLLVATAVAALLARYSRRATGAAPAIVSNRAFQAACALAFFVPLAGSVGTGNPPLEQTTVYAAGFGCLLVLAAAWTTEALSPRTAAPFSAAALAVIGVVLGGQAVVGAVRHPYDLPRNLRHQNVAVASRTLDDVRVDPPTAKMLNDLARIVRTRTTVKPGDLVMTPWPGLIYSLGVEAPFSGWPDEGHPRQCDKFPGSNARIRSTRMILESRPRTNEQTRCLRALWPDYGASFTEVGSFDVPGLPGIRLPEHVVVRVRNDRLREGAQ
jgi:hypothetical protein